ncbi:MAG: hypothetical protein ACREH8_07240, partial [Opitutaceae bacterium]
MRKLALFCHHKAVSVSNTPFPPSPMNSLSFFLPRRLVPVSLTIMVFFGATLTAHSAGPGRSRQVSARNVMPAFAAQMRAANELRPTERAFLSKAIEASRQQMRLAAVGISQATSTEVRSHAQQLATDYRSLNDALEA